MKTPIAALAIAAVLATATPAQARNYNIHSPATVTYTVGSSTYFCGTFRRVMECDFGRKYRYAVDMSAAGTMLIDDVTREGAMWFPILGEIVSGNATEDMSGGGSCR